jgi:hypothetical protein
MLIMMRSVFTGFPAQVELTPADSITGGEVAPETILNDQQQ